jgi:hypothetical protein
MLYAVGRDQSRVTNLAGDYPYVQKNSNGFCLSAYGTTIFRFFRLARWRTIDFDWRLTP